jgi:hypothetical protein
MESIKQVKGYREREEINEENQDGEHRQPPVSL